MQQRSHVGAIIILGAAVTAVCAIALDRGTAGQSPVWLASVIVQELP